MKGCEVYNIENSRSLGLDLDYLRNKSEREEFDVTFTLMNVTKYPFCISIYSFHNVGKQETTVANVCKEERS